MPNVEQFAAPIPAAVKANAERANQLQKEFINPTPSEGEEQPVEGVEEEAPALNGDGEQHHEEPPVDGPGLSPAEDEKTWKHKFLSMQGRYNSEIPKLRETAKAQAVQIGNLNKLLATVQRPEPVKAEETFKSSVTPEEVAEYGPELLDLMARVARDATAEATKEINRLKGLVKDVGGQIATGARAALLQGLDGAVPNWREVNDSAEFVDWLALPDQYSGDIRHNMLKAAFGRNDTPRVIAFFKGFLAEMAALAPDQDEPGKTVQPKTPLKNLAAPGRAKSTAAPNNAPPEKPIFTASQITKFYSDRTMGKFRGREKEAQQIEADIFAAQAEGRIR